MIYRLILPDWAKKQNSTFKKVLEGSFTEDQIKDYNIQGYNVYYFPNYPAKPVSGYIEGINIDTFECVFVDMDLKDGKYKSKDEFLITIGDFGLMPTKVVDSGNGIHVYWYVSDLDVNSYLRLQRRLCRALNTDEAVSKIAQLMRVPNTVNTKNPDDLKLCTVLFEQDNIYTCEQLDKKLPPITLEDEEFCKEHYNMVYNQNSKDLTIDDELPLKFFQLIKKNSEVKTIWGGGSDDRSRDDFRLAHILWANNFTKEEARSVLVNVPKARSRSAAHRINYAENMIDKIWKFEEKGELSDTDISLSQSIKEVLSKGEGAIKGTRFPCWNYIDATKHGFRLSQVIGLVAGSGVGKTAMALNMFMGFVQNNPDYVHFFIPLEQPANEIADRWRSMCGDNTHLHDKVYVLSNYAEDGSFRHLSFDDIKDHIKKFQKVTGKKVGCIVIDHIGALKKQGKNGENQDLMTICHNMKAFAVETNTLLVMQSQTSREKAGIGDIELDKDAAYGTMYFEAYCDYLITMWQPLKRCYNNPKCPTVTSFKFCKIRHKKVSEDAIKEDTRYNLLFDPKTEHMRELTQDEELSFKFFLREAINLRKKDKRSDIVPYESITWTKGSKNGTTDSN